jgi:hypothetical protein
MKNTIVFFLGILFAYVQTNVVEYQKVNILNYEIDKFPKRIVIKTFYAKLENKLYHNYVTKQKHTNPNAIPIYFEFQELF